MLGQLKWFIRWTGKAPRTKDRFHSGGLVSLGGHVFLKLLNILLITLLATKPIPDKEKTWLKAATGTKKRSVESITLNKTCPRRAKGEKRRH